MYIYLCDFPQFFCINITYKSFLYLFLSKKMVYYIFHSISLFFPILKLMSYDKTNTGTWFLIPCTWYIKVWEGEWWKWFKPYSDGDMLGYFHSSQINNAIMSSFHTSSAWFLVLLFSLGSFPHEYMYPCFILSRNSWNLLADLILKYIYLFSRYLFGKLYARNNTGHLVPVTHQRGWSPCRVYVSFGEDGQCTAGQ